MGVGSACLSSFVVGNGSSVAGVCSVIGSWIVVGVRILTSPFSSSFAVEPCESCDWSFRLENGERVLSRLRLSADAVNRS